MFKFSKERKVWWPVKLVTTNEAGEQTTVIVRGLFGLLKADELLALRAEPLRKLLAGAGTAAPDALIAQLEADERAFTDRVAAHVHDWRGIVDDNGDELAFSAEALRALLEWQDMRQAFGVALREASTGAPAKN